jgi:hypothetical protein
MNLSVKPAAWVEMFAKAPDGSDFALLETTYTRKK